MQFYFIRHGQSENNALWQRTGSFKGRVADPGLTDVGHRQAKALVEFIAGVDRDGDEQRIDPLNRQGFFFTHLYTSLLRRAVETGTHLARALEMPLVAWPDIHEEGGMFLYHEETGEPVGLPGPNRNFFAQHYPELMLPDWLGEQGWWNRPYEYPDAVPARARRFWRELLERHGMESDRVAIVSHGAFYRKLLAVLLDLSAPGNGTYPAYEAPFAIHNAAITRVDIEAAGIRVLYTNRLDFMPTELITP